MVEFRFHLKHLVSLEKHLNLKFKQINVTMYFMITKTSLPTIQIWKFRGDFWEKITPKFPIMEALKRNPQF